VTLASPAARVHERLLAGDGEGSGLLRERVAVLARDEAPLLSAASLDRLVEEVVAAVAGLGPLEPFLADPEVTDLLVNGPDRVWVERRGRLSQVTVQLTSAQIEHLIERVVAPLGLRVDRSSPVVDARLPDGSRVNAVLPPVALDGPAVAIRRFSTRTIPLESFCPPDVAALLRWAVRARRNLLVSGGTGAGKTSLLNALAAEIPPGQRLITVEDAAELRLPQDHVVRLEARPANADGVGAISVRDLVRNALRMRPDRIIVGEVRGPEALDMLQAMNTGHEGSLSTCHANSPADALRRIETMVLLGEVALPLAAVREQVAAALDLVVQVARVGDGRRVVVEVAEVEPPDDGSGTTSPRTRRVASASAVVALPVRPPRSAPGGSQW
jgi:pilus assembly protein CpaF